VEVPEFATIYQQRLRVLGRKLLVAEAVKGDTVLRLYDVHTGKDVWKKAYHGKAVALHTDNSRLAGAVQADGLVSVLDVRDGKEVLSTKLKELDFKDNKVVYEDVKDALKEVHEALLLDDGDMFFVALNKPVAMNRVNGGVLYSNFANGTRCAAINGMFYAFDRKGKMRWRREVLNQMVVLEQFRNIPVAIFTVRYNQMAQGGRWQQWVTATEGIEKKTGKSVCWIKPKQYNNGYEFYALNVNVRNGTIDLVGNTNAVRFSLAKGGKGLRTGKAGPSRGVEREVLEKLKQVKPLKFVLPKK
jgi:hypothetical protein